MIRPALLLLIAAGSACSGAKAPASDPQLEAPDVVQLNFAWPRGATGLVAREQSEQEGESEAEVISVVYSIATTPEGSGTRVTFADPRDIVVPGATEDDLSAVAAMFEAVPTILVEKGHVTGVGNTDAMRELFDVLAPIPPDASPEVRARLEQLRTDEAILQSARAEWWTLTALWAGQSLRVGQVIRSKSKMEMFGMGEPVDSDVSVELRETLPCPGAENRSCVRLFYSSEPDPGALARSTAWLVDDARRRGTDFEIRKLSRRTTTELITEPTTLVPFWFEQIEATELDASDNGQPILQTRVKRRTETYTWN